MPSTWGNMGFEPAVGVVAGCAIPARHCAVGTPPVLGGRGVFGRGGNRGPGFGRGGAEWGGGAGHLNKAWRPPSAEYLRQLAAAKLISSPLQASAPSLAVHPVLCRPVALTYSTCVSTATMSSKSEDQTGLLGRVAWPALPSRCRRSEDVNGARTWAQASHNVVELCDIAEAGGGGELSALEDSPLAVPREHAESGAFVAQSRGWSARQHHMPTERSFGGSKQVLSGRLAATG